MQKVIEKSLKFTVLKQITELNRVNAQFYAILRKLNATEYQLNETFNEKLDIMRTDIKDKIKQLASNVDLIYQMFDRKINILIRKIENKTADANQGEQQYRMNGIKIGQLEQEIKEMKVKYNAVLTQNQYLKNKNVSLVEELETMSKRKINSTNDSNSRNMIPKTDLTQDMDTSMEGHLSPIQQPVRTNFRNDLTFNNSPRNISTKKQVRSEENSFSELLIKQQNSFEPSYSTEHNQPNRINRLNFGCMPTRQSGQINFNFKNNTVVRKNTDKLGESQGGQDQSHRLNFLLNNLKDSSSQSFMSQHSGQNYQRGESNGKSVLSKGVVKKYRI